MRFMAASLSASDMGGLLPRFKLSARSAVRAMRCGGCRKAVAAATMADSARIRAMISGSSRLLRRLLVLLFLILLIGLDVFVVANLGLR